MEIPNFDENISKLLDEWYRVSEFDKKTILKLALTSELLSQSFVNKNLAEKKIVSALSYRNSYNIWWTLKKSVWFILWLFKWLLFLKYIKRKKIIISAIGSNLNSTSEYFKQLSKIALQNNCLVIVLNLVESFSILKDSRIVYYPRFLYLRTNLSHNEFGMKTLDEIIDDFKNSAKANNLPVSLKLNKLASTFENLIHDYRSYKYLVEVYLSKKQIVAIVQDYDYTYNKFIYWHISKTNRIKTIVIDTSLTLYKHLYKKVFSDYHFVWGEDKKNFLAKNNSIGISKIIITGKPTTSIFNSTKKSIASNLWLYISQAYSDPAMFISGRDFKSFKKNIEKLSKYQKNHYPRDRFVLKIHPADNPLDYDLNLKLINKVNIFDLLENAKIIFVEDTTLVVDLISRGYPVLYILDSRGNDNIGLVNKGVIPGINLNQNFKETLDSLLNGKYTVNPDVRTNTIKYYNGDYDSKSFLKLLNNILFNDKE